MRGRGSQVFCRTWVVDRTNLGLALGSKGALKPFTCKAPGSLPAPFAAGGGGSAHPSWPAGEPPGEGGCREGWALGRGGLALVHSSKDSLVVALPAASAFAEPNLDPEEVARRRGGGGGGLACSATINTGSPTARADCVFNFK